MNLQLLDFDVTEDAEGVVCWDALACPEPPHTPALLQEVSQVLAWAWRFAAQGPGPLEEGADWDYNLQATLLMQGQKPTPVRLQFDPVFNPAFNPVLGQISLQADPTERHPQLPQHSANFPPYLNLDLPPDCRLELSLSLSGTPGFSQAFRAQFSLP